MKSTFYSIYNIAKFAHKKNIPFIPKILVNINRILFSCDIPVESCIHKSVIFSHNALGVVIHEDAKIGKNTKILHHVTIGGNMGKKMMLDDKVISVPIIGENVLIGVGAKILGPVKIGNNVKIGAGAVVLNDIPNNATAVGIPAKIIKNSTFAP